MSEGVREGRLTASRDAPLGGQAVLEGVMMRGVSTWAVAVRKPAPEDDSAVTTGSEDDSAVTTGSEDTSSGTTVSDDAAAGGLGPIDVKTFPLQSIAKRHRVYRWPVIRGVVALAESLGIGLKALGISANAQLPEEEQEISGGAWAGTVIVALLFAVGLFFVVPVGLTSLIKHQLGSSLLFWLVEGVLRTAIFLGYLYLLSRLRDLRRVFEYHGAEHKVISCYEAEDELTPERAKLYSRLASPLRNELPADRDDHGDLRVRADRSARVVAARPDPHPRRAADRRAVVRGDQVGRPQPAQALGADDHVAGHAAAEADDA